MNIYTEGQYGLYEEDCVAFLDPLLDHFRQQEFYDAFWDIEVIATTEPTSPVNIDASF